MNIRLALEGDLGGVVNVDTRYADELAYLDLGNACIELSGGSEECIEFVGLLSVIRSVCILIPLCKRLNGNVCIRGDGLRGKGSQVSVEGIALSARFLIYDLESETVRCNGEIKGEAALKRDALTLVYRNSGRVKLNVLSVNVLKLPDKGVGRCAVSGNGKCRGSSVFKKACALGAVEKLLGMLFIHSVGLAVVCVNVIAVL